MKRHRLVDRLGRLAGAALAVAAFAGALAASAFAGAAFAGEPDEGRGGRGHGPPAFDRLLERHAERLGLDEATLARIRAIADARRDEADRLAERVRALHGEMRELLDRDDPDNDAVMQQAEAIGAAETAMHKQRLTTLLEIRALLSPEQRRELVRIFEERKRERGSGPHGPRSPDLPPS